MKTVKLRNLTNYKRSVLAAFLFLSLLSANAQSSVQTNVPALKDVYAKDFNIGCILSYRNIGFSTDPAVPGQSAVITPDGGYLVKFHMNSMTPGNNMKPMYTLDATNSAAAYNTASTQADKDTADIHPVIKFNGDLIAQLNWVQRQSFTFRGHTLIWHSQTPTELFRSGYTSSGAYLSKDKMTKRMENYIREVIRLLHTTWPGVLSAMDVVNEAIDDATGSVRTSSNEWYTTFGDNTYIMKAFQFARYYTTFYNETQMKLYYNDYNTSTAGKADGIVTLLTPIFNAGLLDGIGMQEHNSITYPTAANWIATYNKFSPICNEMAVTEIDVNTNSGTNTPSATILASQANQYAALFKCFVERSYKSGRGKIISVTKDGLNDQYTFVTNQSTSLWDAQNQCKPAFYAVADVGKFYNKLDSIIKNTESLGQGTYTTQQWTTITSAVSAGKSARDMNYSASSSAVTGLTTAYTSLKNALSGGANAIPQMTGNSQTFTYINNGEVVIENVPNGAKVSIYNFAGALLKTISTQETTIRVPYTVPCIVRIVTGSSVSVYKVVQ